MQVQRQIDRLLAQRAAEWLDTLKDGDLRDHRAFIEWLRESKLHVEHYLDTECLERQIQSLDPAQGPDIESLLARATSNVRPLNARAAAKKILVRSSQRTWLAAATVAAISLVGAMLGYHFLIAAGRVSTTVGEQRAISLPDGSWARLNVDTQLQIRYGDSERLIVLSAGEALFKVAPDSKRPFLVRTPTAAVRALGTEFNVYQRQATVVSVLEGRVQLTATPLRDDAKASAMSEALGVGEEASVSHGAIERRAHADVAKTMAWRDRRLYFNDMPLTDIVSEFNRYGGPMRLTLEGVDADSHRFDGIFNADDPASLADILAQQSDLQVERRPKEILIRRRPPSRVDSSATR